MITDKPESYVSGKMLQRDQAGYVHGKEREITACLASNAITEEQPLPLSPTQPPFSESLCPPREDFFGQSCPLIH